MCRRYTITASAGELKSRFNVLVPASYMSRYNAAPAQSLPVITNREPETLSLFYWGLIPNLSRNNSISVKLINAELELLEQKASHKSALKYTRCLAPADGYYEWKTVGKKVQVPYRIKRANDALFSFAGLWEEYEDAEGNAIQTFVIITTRASEPVSSIHDRMPVILSPEQENLWLDDNLSAKEHYDLLKNLPTPELTLHTVPPLVNDLKNDNPALIQYSPPADQRGNYTLFG